MQTRRQRPPPRLLRVQRSELVTPHRRRITLGGAALSDFPADSEGASLKLLLPLPGQSDADYQHALAGHGPKPLKRTYTVSRWHSEEQLLEIEFALHDNAGPATLWALQAQAGDAIAVAGPGRDRRVAADADWYLLGADLAALPALAANLRCLPPTAKGMAYIVVPDSADTCRLPAPAGVTVSWEFEQDASRAMQSITDRVTSATWPPLEAGPGTYGIWWAGESRAIRQLRDWFNTRGISPQQRYTGGYWQFDMDEDSYQVVKRQDMVLD